MNVLALAVDPIALGVLYAGTTSGVFRSLDDGVTFAAFGTGLPNWVTTVAVDAEAHAVYAGTDGGLWKLVLPSVE